MTGPEARRPVASVAVEVQPSGSRVQVGRGTTVLAALRTAGLEVASVCGGMGLCATCRVVTTRGGLGPPTAQELAVLGETELAAGSRLACQAAVMAEAGVEVPSSALTTAQRLQFEARQLSHQVQL